VNAVTVFNPGQVPAHLRKGAISAIGKALAGGGQQGNRLSIKGGVFRLVVDGKEVTQIEDRYLDVVIVNAAQKISRNFYMGEYDDSNPTPPTCWSPDGERPHASVKTPQHSNCAQCPQNAKGSGKGDARACRFSQRLAVVLANDMGGAVMQLSLAATSLFGKAEGENRPLQDYARWLGAQGIDPTNVITRLKFDTTVQMPKLFFKPMRWLTEEEVQICAEQATSPDALKAIENLAFTLDNGNAAPPPPAPPVAPAPRAVAPAPAPAAQVEEDEPPPPPPTTNKRGPGRPRKDATPAPLPPEEPEPQVRRAAAPASAVPAAKNIAATLSDWDDE